MDLTNTPSLSFDPKIGLATGRRTYLRQYEDDSWESRDMVAARVAGGNVLIPYREDSDIDAKKAYVYELIELVLTDRRDEISTEEDIASEFLTLFDAIRTGGLLTAGRHLQHGDPDIINRPQEISTNCSTSIVSFVKYLLLLNGSGVGRLYNQELTRVNWQYQPELLIALREDHPDYGKNIDGSPWKGAFITQTEAKRRREVLKQNGQRVRYHTVGDSREGWAKAFEILQYITFQRERSANAADVLVLDFSDVRENGAAIKGMQNRPASGPVPFMSAMEELTKLRDKPYARWEQAMIVDHEIAAVVAVGGVRRAARIAVKYWKDKGIFRFIEFKRSLEHRNEWGSVHYWSSNNSIGVDEEFWSAVAKAQDVFARQGKSFNDFADKEVIGYLATCYDADAGQSYSAILDPVHSQTVKDFGLSAYADGKNIADEFDLSPIEGAVYQTLTEEDLPGFTDDELLAANIYLAATSCGFYDETGEPGFINLDRLEFDMTGVEELYEKLETDARQVIGYDSYQLSRESCEIFREIVPALRASKYPFLVNPCAEIQLSAWGGYCIIGSTAPANLVHDYESIGQRSTEEVTEHLKHLARVQARFLMRVNQLPALYDAEVERTQRIGVGLCGPHEMYMAQFGLSFREVVDKKVYDAIFDRSAAEVAGDARFSKERRDAARFWDMLTQASIAVREEADRYAEELGVTPPHTATMIAPNGSTGKLDNITEGAHLPSMRYYLRNVQHDAKSKAAKDYKNSGYPAKDLSSYQGVTIVGFPTKPTITRLAERLGLTDKIVTAAEATPEEQYRWLHLLERCWIQGEGHHVGNQVSYTLKFNPAEVDFSVFENAIRNGQSKIRCASVIVQDNSHSPDPYGLETDGKPVAAGPYEYLPEQPVTQEVYDQIEASIQQGLDEDIGREHVECEGEACPITFLD